MIKIEKSGKIDQIYCLVWFILRHFDGFFFLFQKLENKIPSYIFLTKTILPLFHEVKLAIYGSNNA